MSLFFEDNVMVVENNRKLILQDGRCVDAINPVIVSASRSTDIPAFYSDWFFKRLEIGYSMWTNPFNGVPMYVSYRDTRFIVFWSKNPKPLIDHLDKLKERGIDCYIQFSINDYEKEGYEPCVPPLNQRIDTFRKLVDKLGKGRVIWRNDPLLLTDKVDANVLLERMERIGDSLLGYTEKMVFSFADTYYSNVADNLRNCGIRYIEWNNDLMNAMARGIANLNQKWGFSLGACAEPIDLTCYGIKPNHCVDEELIVFLAWRDDKLMNYLGIDILPVQETLWGIEPIPENGIDLGNGYYAVRNKNNKDRGQRQYCGCIKSKDIGQYNTCKHLCVYCYANAGIKTVQDNYKSHLRNMTAENITGF